jgi:predicted RNA binding protein YcfA (HicA-like mRNA interferase family)
MASIQARRMIRALVRLGYTLVRASGSHHVLVKAGRPRVVIPVHRGTVLKEGLARGILKDAGITEDDFFDVY